MKVCTVCKNKVEGTLVRTRKGTYVHQECAREVKSLLSKMQANIDLEEPESLNDRIRLILTKHKMENQ